MSAARIPLLVALALTAPCTMAGEYYEGSAYSLDDHRLLYRESHWLFGAGTSDQRLVLYSCADGTAFARKSVDARLTPTAPWFELVDQRSGYREGARPDAAGVQAFIQTDRQAAEQRAQLPLPAEAVIDAGFDAFVVRHWAQLVAGQNVPLSFLIPSQRRFAPFALQAITAPKDSDPSLSWFQLSMTSWYGFVAPHIDVGYDPRTHVLTQYRGLSNIRDASGKHNLSVQIDFAPDKRRSGVPDTEHLQAASRTLTDHCR